MDAPYVAANAIANLAARQLLTLQMVAVGFDLISVAPADRHDVRVGNVSTQPQTTNHMAKKSRGGRMTAAKNRAAKSPGGKGPVAKRPAGLKIMKT